MPKKRQESYKLLKRHICYYLASGVVTMTMPVFVHAEETAASAPVEAEFDSAFLIGDAKKLIFLALNMATLFYLANITLTYM